MNIGGIEIGSGQPCRFVAEISNNHNGSQRRANDLVIAAKTAGADFVKFQCFEPSELVALRGDGPAPEPWGAQGWTMRTLYEKARTPFDWFPELFALARKIGIVPFSSVFGPGSLALLESLNCPAYKIASLDRRQRGLVTAVSATGKPILLSTPSPNSGPLGLGVTRLYCPPGYPTESASVLLPKSHAFEKAPNDPTPRAEVYLGLSSHCLDPRLPIAAVARGAKLLEYHFMLADEPSELEANVSLNQFQFRQMIADVRATEALCGL